MEDFGKRLRLAMISSAARDGEDLRLQVSRPRRMGFCWVGEVVFAGVTHIVGRDLRSDLADPQLRPGWRIDGLVHDRGIATMEASRQIGHGDTAFVLFSIGCRAVRLRLRPRLTAR